ncbi:MAG: hypothetical protein J6P84_01515 [Alphaproteobacteria bacterium]|nr:hypothetical protein [Alphaproteobacteria bacterium]MBO7641562.1 hypothetical protein [Alphaproteobacteria bacterium]
MKKVMFVGCGMFLCLSTVSGMNMNKTMEFSGSSTSIETKCKFSSVDLGSEITLNGEVSSPDSDMIRYFRFNKGRERSRSEEFLSPIPCFDGQQARGFDEGRSRTRSETSISDMLESKKQREERSRLIESENVNCVLKISACQVNRFLGEDFFREFKASHTYADKIKILTRGTVDYVYSCAQQKKEAIEENKALAEQNKLLVRENELQGEYIKKLENKLLIAKAQTKSVSPVVSVKGESSASMEKEEPAFHNQEINFVVPSLHIKKIEYIGDMDENKAHGKGVVSHIHEAFTIAGTFFRNYLDLREKIVIKGSYGEEYEFMGNKNFGQDAMIPMDDISRVNDVYRLNLSTICLKLSNDDGKNEHILFNSDFVYQGELSGRDITGRGRMFNRITGEVQEGEFKKGKYICRK